MAGEILEAVVDDSKHDGFDDEALKCCGDHGFFVGGEGFFC